MSYSTALHVLWSCFKFESLRVSSSLSYSACPLLSVGELCGGDGCGCCVCFLESRAICERREPNGRSDSKLEQARSACGCEGVA